MGEEVRAKNRGDLDVNIKLEKEKRTTRIMLTRGEKN